MPQEQEQKRVQRRGEDAAPAETVVRHLSRTGILSGFTRNGARYARYHLEFATFAVALWPHLMSSCANSR